MEILIVGAFIGLIPACIASSKGHSFGLWWFYGAMLFIVALPHSFFIKNQSGKLCGSCKEYVDETATKCKFCGSFV